MLTGIDYFVVIAYLVGILLLGLYFRKFVHSSTDFFLGGRMLPFWAIGMSIVVSDIGALDFVGIAGSAYRHGISVGNFDWIGSVPAMLLAAFIFIPCFWKSRIYTIPEYLGRRYNDGVRTIASLTWIIFFAFNIGIIFWASAVLLDTLMGWPRWVSILATASVVGLYTFCGGLTAVIMTDVVQMIIMFVGGGAVVFLGFFRVGGWSGLVEKISQMGPAYQEHFELIMPVDTQTPFPWTGILFGLTFVMANAYMIGNQSIVQRCFSAKNEWHAKASMIFAAFLKMLIPVLVLFPGLVALVLHPELKDGDEALPTLIRTRGIAHVDTDTASPRTGRTHVRGVSGRTHVQHRLGAELDCDDVDQGFLREVYPQGRLGFALSQGRANSDDCAVRFRSNYLAGK